VYIVVGVHIDVICAVWRSLIRFTLLHTNVYIVVSAHIAVMCAVRLNVKSDPITHKRVHSGEHPYCFDVRSKAFTQIFTLHHTNVYIVVSAHIAVICVVRRSLKRVTLHHTNVYIVASAHIILMRAVWYSPKEKPYNT
jgi:hypothetical protein